MEGPVVDVERLTTELISLEDRFVWDVPVTLEAAERLERTAAELGDDELVVRARLVQANMWMRRGEVAAAARRIRDIDQWAQEHHRPMIRARAQLHLTIVHHQLGDPATSLEHAIRAVEFLDANASIHAAVWHRVKLADALASAGSVAAARTRYAQAEQLAVAHGEHRLHMAVLNNHAYAEYTAGANELAGRVVERLRAKAALHGFRLDPADLDTIGNIQLRNGQFAEAERTLHACIGLHAEGHHGTPDQLAEYLLTLCRVQRGLGAIDRAQLTLDKSRTISIERGLGEVLVRVHQAQAELHAARGEFAEAYAVHKVFFAAYDRLRSTQREAQARTRQALFETAEAREEAERFREQARRDPLTGLRNRRYVDEQLPELIAEPGMPVTIAILDLDHFKRVNDELSHDVGDQVLRMVAGLLEADVAEVAPGGFAARLGGEEFLLALPGLTAGQAVTCLEVLRVRIRSHPWRKVTGRLPVTVSIGVASTDGMTDPNQRSLLSNADSNLYAAKHGGRDQVVSGPARTVQRRRDRA